MDTLQSRVVDANDMVKALKKQRDDNVDDAAVLQAQCAGLLRRVAELQAEIAALKPGAAE